MTRIGRRRLSDLVQSEALHRLLAATPDPEAAVRRAQRLLATPMAQGATPLAAALDEAGHFDDRQIGRILHAICGVAPFFTRIFARHPDWLLELSGEHLARPRDPDELATRLDTQLFRATDEEVADTLRRFKYYELARLTVRDCCEEWVPLSHSHLTLSEVSQLADVLLDRALALAVESVRRRDGPPRWPLAAGGEAELSFCVLALGKLGSEELNYSSDVDLVYVHASPPGALASAPGKPSPLEYYTRLAQTFGRLVSATSLEGMLYRVDLDLRPEGAQGTLVVSEDGLATYYEAWAHTWERAAFMKARPVAGDLELGWRAIRRVAPMIYRSGMDFRAVEGIRSLKTQVAAAHGAGDSGFDVKLDEGGIRDIEFIAQALQLIHGGRIPQIRARSTRRALERLAEVGLLEAEHVDVLLQAYLFMRRTENRLQMEGEQQRHRLPAAGAPLRRLARSMGFLCTEPEIEFHRTLGLHRDTVRSYFDSAFAQGGRERILELFARNVPQLIALPTTRGMIEELAEQLAHSIDESAEPERSLNSLDRFIQNVGTRRFYYELLLDRPELVPRLAALFAASQYLSGYLATHPRLIESLFVDADTLLLSRRQLRVDFESILERERDGQQDPVQEELNALRLFHHRQVLNIGLLDVGEKIERSEAETALSELADVCVEIALEMAARHLRESGRPIPAASDDGAYLVVGMGKLGSRELSYGSDLDLIFLYAPANASERELPIVQDHFVRLTQRLISCLQASTAEGACYEIDARLRPSGAQGMLVSSLDAFRRYHESGSQVWERQALLRARPVAGDAHLAQVFESLRYDVLVQAPEPDLAAQVDAVRLRMERELARETPRKHNFKTGRGGLLDVECVVQTLQLLRGAQYPELLEIARMEDHLTSIGRLALLHEDDVGVLRRGWGFLQSLANRLRIVENRSISDLDEERGDIEGLAIRLGYEPNGRPGSPRRAMLRDYRRHTEAIRAVYERVLHESAAT